MRVSPSHSLSRRRVAILVAAVVACGALLGAGWGLASVFQSPAQREANARPPAPKPVLAAVQEGPLQSRKLFTGQVGPSSRASVVLQPASEDALSVVTSRPLSPGDTVQSGHVLTEVNGRPVHIAQSSFAFYRSLGYGDSGPDVGALQKMLLARGFRVSADGSFGSATADAVASLYRASGYTAPTRQRTDAAAGSPPSKTGGATPPDASSPSASEVQPARDTYVPISEIATMPYAHGTVVQGLAVGRQLGTGDGADIVIGSPDVVVTVTVSAADASGVSAGAPATISISGTDVSAKVGASKPADTAKTEGDKSSSDTTKSQFPVTPDQPLEIKKNAATARVTITRTLVEKAMIVPVLAVIERGSSDAVVVVQNTEGDKQEVPVTIVATLDGQAAVQPKKAGALTAGMNVRVG